MLDSVQIIEIIMSLMYNCILYFSLISFDFIYNFSLPLSPRAYFPWQDCNQMYTWWQELRKFFKGGSPSVQSLTWKERILKWPSRFIGKWNNSVTTLGIIACLLLGLPSRWFFPLFIFLPVYPSLSALSVFYVTLSLPTLSVSMSVCLYISVFLLI